MQHRYIIFNHIYKQLQHTIIVWYINLQNCSFTFSFDEGWNYSQDN